MHEQKRVSMGKQGKMVDHSMNAVRAVEDTEAVKTSQNQGHDNSLDDLTDWQNEDFVYVY